MRSRSVDRRVVQVAVAVEVDGRATASLVVKLRSIAVFSASEPSETGSSASNA